MNARTVLENQWEYLLTFFPSPDALSTSAFQSNALRRKRSVSEASQLLRLALAYGFCGLSLRQTAAWAEAAHVASLSDVALLKRLRNASAWLGSLLGAKLAERAAFTSMYPGSFRLRLIDATTISRPGSTGTDWRVHLGFDLTSLAIQQIEVTDQSGGETFCRFKFMPGDLALGDRGYAHRAGLHSVANAGAHFLVRVNWQNIPLLYPDGQPFDMLSVLRALPEAQVASFDIHVAADRSRKLPPLPARLIALRKTEAAAEQSRQKVLSERGRKGKSPDPRSLEAAAYFILLTTASDSELTATQALELYRFRWQVELAFKRMKGLLELGSLPAKDPALARTILCSKLLAALLLDDFTERFLSISPWGYSLHGTPTVAVENSARLGR